MRHIESMPAVLVVDDEQNIRDACERILRRMGYPVYTAGCGEESLSIVAEKDISIIILDLKMPGMDGMEVLSRVRGLDKEILVIVITGFATVETAIEAMKSGAYDFIPKPFEPDQLRIAVKRAHEKLRLKEEAELLKRDRQRTLTDLHAEKSRLRTVIKFIPNGVLVTNSEGMVVLINPSLRKHLGLSPDCPPGRPLPEYIADKELSRFIMRISQGEEYDIKDVPTTETESPSGRDLLVRGQPVLSLEGERLGAVILFTDITELKNFDRLKSEFVAKVSHELRSPLATIHEQLAAVMNEISEDETEENIYILNRAREKTEGMIALIGDLLDLSRIEAGNEYNTPREIDTGELLAGIVDFMTARAESKSQSISFENSSRDPHMLLADPIALESIFGNLISNAVKYTPEKGKIQVIMERKKDILEVKVRDTGYGMTDEETEKIFQKFYRIKNRDTRFITGTGLGLSIVKSLVESLDGEIGVTSRPGEGSTFTVKLPLLTETEKAAG